ncbi:MAG: BspA family leucine-rich repeat surface protein [Firmicutes bacterium]|nr:BspA family leucine-rich repeat surface protein [Bacillota bacterium]
MKYNFVSKLIKVAAVPVFLASLALLPQGGIADMITNNVNVFAETYADYDFATIYSDGDDLVLDLKGELPVNGLRDTYGERISSAAGVSGIGQYITKIVSTSGAKLPADCTNYFLGYKNCKTIDLTNVDTSAVLYATGMFDSCSSVEEINMKSFANSHIVVMDSMFQNCSALKTMDLSCITDTSSLTDIHSMFFNCTALKCVNMSSFNSSNINEIEGIFWGCTSLKSVNIENLNLNVSELVDETVPTMIFSECNNLENIIMNDSDFLEHIFEKNSNKNTVYVYTDKSIAETYADPSDTKFKFVTVTSETNRDIDSPSSTKSYRSYCFDKKGDVYLIYHTSSLAPESVEVRYVGSETAGNYKMNDILKPTDEKILAEPFTKVYESIKFEDGSELKPALEGEYIYAIKLTGANALKPVNIDFYENAAPAEDGENIKE